MSDEIKVENFLLLLQKRLEIELRKLNATDEEIVEILKRQGLVV